MIDYRPQHATALAELHDLVRHVGRDDLHRATPCTGWDLGDLLAHLVGQHHGFAAAIRGADVGLADFAPVAELGDDWLVADWGPSVVELRDATAAAALDRRVPLPEVSPTHRFSVATVVSFHLVDTVAHTWDVATALGRDHRPTPSVLDAFVAEARRVPDGDGRTAPGAAFGPVVDHDGDAWSAALAHLGRRAGVAVGGRGVGSGA